MNLDFMIEALEAKGATQEQIDEFVATYSQAKYEPQTVRILPAFYTQSDHSFPINGKDVPLRVMNGHDIKKALPFVHEFVRMLMSQAGDQRDLEDALKEMTSMGFLGKLFKKIEEVYAAGGDEYPKWFAELLELVCDWINEKDEQGKPLEGAITPGHIIALSSIEQKALMLKLWEVNESRFLELWASVPHGIQEMISTLVSPIILMVKEFGTRISGQADSTGGRVSTGKRTSSKTSAKKRATAKASS